MTIQFILWNFDAHNVIAHVKYHSFNVRTVLFSFAIILNICSYNICIFLTAFDCLLVLLLWYLLLLLWLLLCIHEWCYTYSLVMYKVKQLWEPQDEEAHSECSVRRWRWWAMIRRHDTHRTADDCRWHDRDSTRMTRCRCALVTTIKSIGVSHCASQSRRERVPSLSVSPSLSFSAL